VAPAIATGDRTEEEATPMRQVRRPLVRARKPTPMVGPAYPAVRPSVWRWLERLDPCADPWPRPTIPTHREER
jgi:hypothetical protein